MNHSGVLLYPGAGTTSEHPSLAVVGDAVADLPGVTVRRGDFPYRRAGRKAPDRAPVLAADIRRELAEFRAVVGHDTQHMILGGRSMGGRLCSIVAAGPGPGAVDDEPAVAVTALILISYPLHPPGRPERLRVEHLPRLTMPCLFVHGTRDPFGTPDELTQWTATIPGPVTHVWIDGGRHELAGAHHEVASVVADWCRQLPALN